MPKPPVIDLVQLLNAGTLGPNRSDFSKNEILVKYAVELREALNEFGTFYIINHGIPSALISRLFLNGKTFFQLPNDVKENYRKDSSDVMDITKYHGYNREGDEKLNPDEANWEVRESFDCIRKYGKYPNSEVPGFQDDFLELISRCEPLIKLLLRLLAFALNLDVDFFLSLSRHLENPDDFIALENVRFNYYAPVNGKSPKRAIRAATHSDYDIMTFLFQDSGGLEVLNVNGQWMQINPVPDSIIVLTGLTMEYCTKGFIRAAPHRVLIPDDEILAHKSRQSIVYFHGADNDAIVYPVDITLKSVAPNRAYSDYSKSAREITMGPMVETFKGYAKVDDFVK